MRLKSSSLGCPFFSLHASTPRYPATVRSMISCLVISSENNATFLPCFAAALRAMSKARLVFPALGRAAMTVSEPGDSPVSIRSRSLKPVGSPKRADLSFASCRRV